MVILVLFLLVALLASAAFSVDVAYMQLTRTQLRAATDAAARAGAEAITRTGDTEVSRQTVRNVGLRNLVAGRPLAIADEDIIFGNTSPDENEKWAFVANKEPLNSVLGDRTSESLDGEVSLFFGNVLGTPFFEPAMRATVAKTSSPKRDFCLVVDRSHSMAFDLSGRSWSYPPGPYSSRCRPPHPTQSRWAALVQSVNGFVAALEDTEDEERVGLVSYASAGRWCGKRYGDSTIDHPLTDTHTSIVSLLNQRSKRPIPGGTNIYAGIVNGIRVLTDRSRARSDAKKLMVVMTDGRHNRGPSPVIAARSAARDDIQIISITFSNGADQDRRQQVAAATGGSHYHAPSAQDLRRIFEQVAVGLDNLVFIE